MRTLPSTISLLVLIALADIDRAFASVTNAAATACRSIEKEISSQSAVYYAPSLNYYDDLEHYMSSSSQDSTCVVEVGSDNDAALVMKTIAATRAPFAIKSGGHASNQGFSSTPGVQISLVRLKTVSLSKSKRTVTVGMGNIWTDVYKALDGSGYNVVGGRVTGPGTGGFTLGGGFSWLTNQYGLTCDTVEEYTLILPNGTISHIGPSQKDLFFALKGGLNRFGLVTQIIFKAVPQIPIVYGGYQLFDSEAIPDLITATNYFGKHNKDPKAQVILTINGGEPAGAILLSFYDGPSRPSAFDPYNGIQPIISNVSSWSFLDFAQSAPVAASAGRRGAFNSLSTTSLTEKFLQACYNESQYVSQLRPLDLLNLYSYDVEPFDKSYGRHATDSAYPHSKSPRPLNLYFAWELASEDAFWQQQIVQSLKRLKQVAIEEGIYSNELYTYPNYAIAGTPADVMYGSANAARLRAISASIDPDRVMELTGGFEL